MGLRNAPAPFQALMNSFFYDNIDEFLVIYLDDILIYSNTRVDHSRHLRIVLQRSKKDRLYTGKIKYELMITETEFLVLQLGKEEIVVEEERKRTVAQCSKPTNIRTKEFGRVATIFQKIHTSFFDIAAPLTSLTKKGNGIANWNEECEKSFQVLKEKLVSSHIMKPPNSTLPFRRCIDASQLAVGGILTQVHSDVEHPVSYFSKRLTPTEKCYSQNYHELLGPIYFLLRFRCYLEGSLFEVPTDNHILKSFTKPSPSRSEARWLDFLGQFLITSLMLVKRKLNVLGNPHTRAPETTKSTPNTDILKNVFSTNNTSVEVVEMIPPRGLTDNYEDDHVFEKIVSELYGILPKNQIQQEKTS